LLWECEQSHQFWVSMNEANSGKWCPLCFNSVDDIRKRKNEKLWNTENGKRICKTKRNDNRLNEIVDIPKKKSKRIPSDLHIQTINLQKHDFKNEKKEQMEIQTNTKFQKKEKKNFEEILQNKFEHEGKWLEEWNSLLADSDVDVDWEDRCAKDRESDDEWQEEFHRKKRKTSSSQSPKADVSLIKKSLSLSTPQKGQSKKLRIQSWVACEFSPPPIPLTPSPTTRRFHHLKTRTPKEILKKTFDYINSSLSSSPFPSSPFLSCSDHSFSDASPSPFPSSPSNCSSLS